MHKMNEYETRTLTAVAKAMDEHFPSYETDDHVAAVVNINFTLTDADTGKVRSFRGVDKDGVWEFTETTKP